MKKILSTILALALACAALTSCGSTASNNTEAPKSSADSEITLTPEPEGITVKQLPSTVATADYFTAAVKEDGSVLLTGTNSSGMTFDVSAWTDITEVAAGDSVVIGLKTDGTVVVAGDANIDYSTTAQWQDIVSIAAGINHVVGVKADGTVLAAGSNDNEQCNVSVWSDIKAVFAYNSTTIGLQRDGTLLITGYGAEEMSEITSWEDIVSVATSMSGGSPTIVGLTSDGTIMSVGKWKVDKLSNVVAISGLYAVKADGTIVDLAVGEDVSEWTDVMNISSTTMHVIGLKADGTLLYAGNNLGGEGNVAEWTDIKLPR